MKKIIPFEKDLDFDNKIYDVISIALEHNLGMENEDSIVGDFVINGKYKTNNINDNEESFEKIIPFDITLDDKYDAKKVEIDIDDFYYEVVDESFLRVHIDVLVDNLVYVKKEEPKKEIVSKEIINNDDNDERGEVIMTKDENDVILESEEKNDEVRDDNMEEVQDEEVNIADSLTGKFLSDNDNYVTYKVHIIRETETVEDIISLYNVPKEELEKYNQLSDITIGTKLIIPVSSE